MSRTTRYEWLASKSVADLRELLGEDPHVSDGRTKQALIDNLLDVLQDGDYPAHVR